jgi:hypothetical protein
MYLRKMNPGVILRIPAKRIYNYESTVIVPDPIDFVRRQVAYLEMEEDEIYEDISEEGNGDDNDGKIKDISSYYAEAIRQQEKKKENIS